MAKEMSREDVRNEVIAKLRDAVDREIPTYRLTKEANDLLKCLTDYIKENLFSDEKNPAPTYEEIGKMLNKTEDKIRAHVASLTKKRMEQHEKATEQMGYKAHKHKPTAPLVDILKYENVTFTRDKCFIVPHAYTIVEKYSGKIFKLEKPELFPWAYQIDHKPKPTSYRYFVGREEEVKKLKIYLEANTLRISIVYGMSGIGKTSLVSRMVDDIQSSGKYYHVFWNTFIAEGSFTAFLERCANFLSKLGKTTLREYLEKTKEIDVSVAGEILRRDIADKQILFILDDTHTAPKKVINILRYFVQVSESIPHAKFIIIIEPTKEYPSPRVFYGPQDIYTGGIVQEIKLEPLSIEECRNIILKKKGNCDENRLKKLYEISSGNPLLFLIADTIPEIKDVEKEKEKYLRQKIFLELSENEKTALKKISVFKEEGGVPSSILVGNGVDTLTLDNLVEHTLLEKSQKGHYKLHNMIKGFVYPMLKGDEKIAYHLQAARYYEDKRDMHSLKESVEHFAKAKKVDNMVKVLTEHATAFTWDGDTRSLRHILEGIDVNDLPLDLQDNYYRLKGNLLQMELNFEMAKECYQKNLEVLERIKETGKIDREGYADTERNLGYVCWRSGEFKNAKKHLRNSLEMFKALSNDLMVADVYAIFGNLYGELGEMEKSLEYYKKSLDILKKVESIGHPEDVVDAEAQKARVYTSRCEVHHDMNMLSEALSDAKKAITIVEERNLPRLQSYAYAIFAKCLAEKKNLQDAVKNCDRAFEYAKWNEDVYVQSFINRVYGTIYKYERDWSKSEKYFNKSLKLLCGREKGEKVALYDYGNTLYELGKMYKSKGDNKKAKKCFQDALKILKKIGAKLFIKKLKEEISVSLIDVLKP